MTIHTPRTAILKIESDVKVLVEAGVLSRSQGGLLVNKLDAALANLDRGNTQGAVRKLHDFNNQVGNFIQRGYLTETQGQFLIDESNLVIGHL